MGPPPPVATDLAEGWKWWGDVCGLLVFLLPLNLIGLLVNLNRQSRWTRVVESSGFRGWSWPQGLQLLTISFAVGISAAVLAICALCAGNCTKRLGCTFARVAVASVAVMSWVGILSFAITGFPENEAVALFTPQVDAVATFNRLYCQAWCHDDATSMAMAARGECGVATETVFHDFVWTGNSSMEVEAWCTQAIATQAFQLTATHTGFSPFATMKKEPKNTITDDDWSIGMMLLAVPIGMANIVLLRFACVPMDELPL